MMLEAIAGIIAIAGALIALSARTLMRSILGLALVFLGIAGLLASLGAWYLAIGQLFLFIGGIVTFLVLVFSSAKTPLASGHPLVTIGLVALVLIILSRVLPASATHASISAVDLAGEFFTRYAMLLIPGILILLAALIAAQHLMGERA